MQNFVIIGCSYYFGLKIAPKSHESLIAIFTPLIANFCSAIMEHGSLYFGAAVMYSLLQAERDGLLYTVVLGVIFIICLYYILKGEQS